MPSQHIHIRDQVRQRYNHVAEKYAYRYQGHLGRYYYHLETRRVLDLVNFRGKRVLDLGTGTGRLALSVSRMAGEVVGIDLSSKMIEVAEQIRAKEGIKNASFLVGDATQLTFSANSFDIVVSLGMFEYVNDFHPFLVEIRRVLVPEGKFVFSCYNKRELFPRRTLRGAAWNIVEHSVSEIKEQLESEGFQLVSCRGTFYIPSEWVWWGYKHVFHWLKKPWVDLVIGVSRQFERLDRGWARPICSELIIVAERL